MSRPSRDGFVQIGALAGLAVVAGIVTVSLGGNAGLTRGAVALERTTLASITADSGIRRLLSSIENPADPLAMAVGVSGTPYPVELEGRPMDLAIEGEAGKINPLTVAMPVLERYLSNARPAADMTALLTALDVARAAGDQQGVFEAIETYLSPALSTYDLARDFTDRSRLAGIDPQFASERVLRALPDLSADELDEIMRRRRTEPGALDRGLSRYFASGGAAFTLAASVDVSNREAHVRRVPVELTTAGRVLVLDGFR